jgi:uncharacterized PurR-regulated membrane protein YhhQ (DUF165 family)
MIQSFTIEYANATSNVFFSNDEQVTFSEDNVVVGNAIVKFSNSSTLTVQDVFGNTSAANLVLTGLTSNVVATSLALVTTMNVIPVDEASFYSPVYAYDQEQTTNAERREAVLIDARFTTDINVELKTLLNA